MSRLDLSVSRLDWSLILMVVALINDLFNWFVP